MLVGIVTSFRSNRKEPLAVPFQRIHAAFPQSGEPEPLFRFVFADSGALRANSNETLPVRLMTEQGG
jgi:hypothetical protein